MEYNCTACGQKVPGDMMVFRDHTEKHIVELIKSDHPEWMEKDGICQKCLQYYKQELDGSVFHDVACVKRQRKVKGIVGWVKGIFGGNKK